MQKHLVSEVQQQVINKYIKELSLSEKSYKQWGCLSDIIDAITSGSAKNSKQLLAGHGWDYYYGGGTAIQLTTAGRVSKQNTEIFANFVEMKLGGYHEQLKYMKENLPTLYDELNNEYKKVAKILGGNK